MMENHAIRLKIEWQGSPMPPEEVARVTAAALHMTAGPVMAHLTVRVEQTGQVSSRPAFADQPSASFRCPGCRTDEHDATFHLTAPMQITRAEQVELGLRHQPNPHASTFGRDPHAVTDALSDLVKNTGPMAHRPRGMRS